MAWPMTRTRTGLLLERCLKFSSLDNLAYDLRHVNYAPTMPNKCLIFGSKYIFGNKFKYVLLFYISNLQSDLNKARYSDS